MKPPPFHHACSAAQAVALGRLAARRPPAMPVIKLLGITFASEFATRAFSPLYSSAGLVKAASWMAGTS